MRSYGEARCIDQQKPKTHKNFGEVQSDLLHELPDWLQEFRENLVDERRLNTNGVASKSEPGFG